MEKVNELIADLNYALTIGEMVEAEEAEDNGGKNKDGVCLSADSIDEQVYKKACKKLKMKFKKKSFTDGEYYLIEPRTKSSSSKRSANAEAVCMILRDRGYSAYDYAEPIVD